MKIHPLADLFPAMSDKEFAVLVADIKANGLLEPIATYQGSIIDGKHRFKACTEAKIKPNFVEYTGDDPLSFVFSRNLSRRHLNTNQKSLIGITVANGKRGGDRKSDQTAHGQFDLQTVAKLLGISERSLERARKIMEDGSERLKSAFQNNEVSPQLGALLAELPKSEQDAELRNALSELSKIDRGDSRKRKAVIKKIGKRWRRDPNKEADLNSHAWECATLALRQKWIGDVTVKQIWEAMTDEQKDQLFELAEAEDAESERILAAAAS